jgi:hypothetical protein
VKHAKPRTPPRPVQLTRAASRHPIRTLRRGQSKAVNRWGMGLGFVAVAVPALAVAAWVIATLSRTV